MFNHESLGKLCVRLIAGGLLLIHGISKLKHGISGIEGMVESHGFPKFMAYGVFLGEVIAPVLMLLGYFSRLGALIAVVNMVFAILLAHSQDLFRFGSDAWPELALIYLFASLGVLFLGSGSISVSRGSGQYD